MEHIFNAGNLYEINKQLMSSIDPLDPVDLHRKLFEAAGHIKKPGYYMLLSNEKRDYTVFNISKWASDFNIADEIQSLLLERGLVTSIDRQKDGNWEIWIRDIATEENIVYYLFDYAFGVIEVD